METIKGIYFITLSIYEPSFYVSVVKTPVLNHGGQNTVARSVILNHCKKIVCNIYTNAVNIFFMDFESYANFSPFTASITRTGYVRLSLDVVKFLQKKFGSGPLFAELKFERKLNLLGIKVQKEPANSLAKMTPFKITKKSGVVSVNAFVISAKRALRAFDVDYVQGGSCHVAAFNEQLGLLIVDLNSSI